VTEQRVEVHAEHEQDRDPAQTLDGRSALPLLRKFVKTLEPVIDDGPDVGGRR